MSNESLGLADDVNLLISNLSPGNIVGDTLVWADDLSWKTSSNASAQLIIQDDTSLPNTIANTTYGNLYKKASDSSLYWKTLSGGEINTTKIHNYIDSATGIKLLTTLDMNSNAITNIGSISINTLTFNIVNYGW